MSKYPISWIPTIFCLYLLGLKDGSWSFTNFPGWALILLPLLATMMVDWFVPNEDGTRKPHQVDAEMMTTILRRCPEGILVIRGKTKSQQTYHYAVGGLAFELTTKADFAIRDGTRVVDLRSA